MENDLVNENLLKKKNSGQFNKVILFVLIGLSVIQQMPLIKDYYYEQLRIVLYLGFGLISLISLRSIFRAINIPFIT
jgi:predicted membrane channel-forming protein YqfA (hemolysin III family)